MGLPLLLNDIVLIAQVGSLLIFASIFLVLRIPKPEVKSGASESLGSQGLNPAIKLFLVS